MLSNSNHQSVVQGKRVLMAVTPLMLGYGIIHASSELTLLAYCLVVAASLLPSIFWLRTGAQGIPILPAFALAHIPYFALPVVRSQQLLRTYDEYDILVAAATVALFLLASTAGAHLGARVRKTPRTQEPESSARKLSILIVAGLITGLGFQVLSMGGWLYWTEGFYGTIRSVATTFALVACYCLGVGAGRRVLTQRTVAFAALLTIANVLVSWSSLFLVGGLLYLLSCGLGFVVATGRVPWKSFLLVFVVVSVLQAGKRDMRDDYWEEGANYGSNTQIKLVDLLTQWTVRGLEVIALREKSTAAEEEEDPSRPTVADRTSLLPIMLRVQELAPEAVDYLYGETYALLPRIILPRFIYPGKLPSQAGMNLLNIHFGVLLEHQTESTAVGWGLASEGYANFGYFGVIGMGLAVGVLARWLTNKSARSTGISLPTLIAIAVLIGIVNMEADFTVLSLTLIQSAVAVFIFYHALQAMTRREARKRTPHPHAVVPRKANP